MPLDSGGSERRQKRSLNVLGSVLEPCSYDPITGFIATGAARRARRISAAIRFAWR